MPIHEQSTQVNVNAQLSDDRSLLNSYKSLLRVRNQSKVLQEGSLQILESAGEILAYVREHGESRVLVLMNFGDSERNFVTTTDFNNELFSLGQVSLTGSEGIILGPNSGTILSS